MAMAPGAGQPAPNSGSHSPGCLARGDHRAPWYGRDIAVYGWPDFLGLIRHDAIVIGQTRTAEFIAQNGWIAYGQRAIEFTFKSFWGVFGWLGVFLDSRVYLGLAVLSGITAGGLILRVARGKWQMANGKRQMAIRLLIVSTLLTFSIYAWYNAQFVQHQGRYLFTALIPIALAFAAGWDAALRSPNGRLLGVALGILGVGLTTWSLLTGRGLPKWPLAIVGGFAGGLMIVDCGQRAPLFRALRAPRSPRLVEAFSLLRVSPATWRAVRSLAFALPYAALPFLSLYALFGAIAPQLGR